MISTYLKTGKSKIKTWTFLFSSK